MPPWVYGRRVHPGIYMPPWYTLGVCTGPAMPPAVYPPVYVTPSTSIKRAVVQGLTSDQQFPPSPV